MTLKWAPFIELDREQLRHVHERFVPELQATITLTEEISNIWDFADPEHRWGLDAGFRKFHRDFSKSATRPGHWDGDCLPRLYGFVEASDWEINVTIRVGREEWMSYGTFDHVLDMAFSWHLVDHHPYGLLDVEEVGFAAPTTRAETVFLFPSFFSENPAVAAEIFERADEADGEVGRANLHDFITG